MRAVLLIALALILPAEAHAAPLRVVASFTILADMARLVGGDRVQVASLVGPNGDPHAFEPSPGDARALKQADIILVNGLGLEGWMDRLIAASGTHGHIVTASAGIPTRRMTEDGRPVADPHAWNDAANGVSYVANIVQAFSAADPPGAPLYRANGARMEDRLRALDSFARASVASVPPGRRVVVTSHDSFGYFGAAYGVTFLSPMGFSTESEPSARDVAALIRLIKRQHVRAFFLENSTDPRLVRQIAHAAGGEPGPPLYVESLSAPDGPAPSYEAMFRRNVRELTKAMKEEKNGVE